MSPLDDKPAWLRSVCPHDCPSTCALEVERLSPDTIGKVRGNALNDYTDGAICAKVAVYRERVHHPDRLTHPMRRIGAKGEGKFERISWDDALDIVADEFTKSTQKHGRESVWPYHFAGTMGLVQRDIIHGFRHALGYSREDETICVTTAASGWLAGCGKIWGSDPREMAVADMIVIWGGNPVSTQVNVMSHVSKARKNRGAKLYVVDPYRTPTAQQADVHLCLKPGTDGALACAVMHVLFRDGYADWEYMAQYTDVPAELETHIRDKTPEWAADITGLDVAEIEAFAATYGRTERAYIRVGYGFTRSRNGTANMHAVSCLPAVGGKWQTEGGGAMHSNRNMFGVNQSLIRAADTLDTSIRALDMSRIGPILVGDEASLLGGPPVHAMIMQNINPAEVAPELNKVVEGLKRDDLFVCVHEQFPTATIDYADVVLPATTFLEHDDLYQGGGHMYLQVGKKIIEPLAECRSNVEVLSALARRLGSDHELFTLDAWEIIDRSLRATGYPGADETHAAGWIDCSKPFEDAHFLSGFPTTTGKFHFKPDWSTIGADFEKMPVLPDHMDVIDNATAEKPFRLVAAPARRFLNTSFTETPSSVKKEGQPTVLVHPDTMAHLDITEGDDVELGNDLGQIIVAARAFDGVQPDTLVVEGIWPNKYFKNGVGVNALTSAGSGIPERWRRISRHRSLDAARQMLGVRGRQVRQTQSRVIVIGNEKGGSGKSTTAMHMAVALMRRGYAVATVDVDGRQGTLSRYTSNRAWFNKKMGRDYPLADHHKVAEHAADGMSDAEVAQEAEKLKLLIEGASFNHDVVIVDTPGAANKLSYIAHTYADILVTPMNDSFVDLDVLAHMDNQGLNIKGPSHYAEAIWEAKKERAERDGGSIDWIVIRNRLTNLDAFNKREMEQALRELSRRLGFRCVPGFAERVIFRELFLVGLTIVDLKQAAGGAPLSRSHISARDEVYALADSLNLPEPAMMSAEKRA